MNRKKLYLCIICVITITIFLAGCNEKDDENDDFAINEKFTFSDHIDKNGFWIDVTAKDYVEMGQYKGIAIPEEYSTVTEGGIQKEVDSILSKNPVTVEVKDREVKDGDIVNIDFSGKIDGKEFKGSTTNGEGAEITVGEANFIDDFEEQIVGHTPGETFSVEVTFPTDYPNDPELQGKDAVYETTINHIVEKVSPKLTDKFVDQKLKKTYGWTTVSDMKRDIKRQQEDDLMDEYIREYLLMNFSVSQVPADLLQYQEDGMIKYYSDMAKEYDKDITDVIKTMGYKSVDDLLKTESQANKANAEYMLIIQAIAEDLEMEVTQKDIDVFFAELHDTMDYDTYIKAYGLPYVKQSVLLSKVNKYIRENRKEL